MKVLAKLNYLRIAPRKVRLVADLIRGKSAEEAQVILKFTVKKASLPLAKLLKSAINNAKNNLGLEESGLYISKITVDEGPKLKRWRARSRGQAFEIQKKTSHVTLVLESEGEKPKKKTVKKGKKVKTAKKEVKEEKPEKEEKQAPHPRFRPRQEMKRPEFEKQTKKVFRRKAF